MAHWMSGKRLCVGAIDLAQRRLVIRRIEAKTDASARCIELNRDATVAAERLLLRAGLLGATDPAHYLMPKKVVANIPRRLQRPARLRPQAAPEVLEQCVEEPYESGGTPWLQVS
jgi:hypothetical protein